MNTLHHLQSLQRVLMSPLRPRSEIFHFKFTRALTQSNVNRFIAQLRSVQKERPSVLMLSINTAVGSFAQAQRAHDALQLASFHLNVPLYTFVEDYALGVGYYLLSAGKVVHANPFSIVGDFSLSHRSFGFTKLLDKYNIQYEEHGKSILLDAFRKVTDENQRIVKQSLDVELNQLIEQVKVNRKSALRSLDDTQLQQVLSPKAYTVNEALENGLVDRIETFEDFVNTNYPNFKVKEVSVEKDTTQQGVVRAQLENKILEEIQVLKGIEITPQLIQHVQSNLLTLLTNFIQANKLEHSLLLNEIIADFINHQIVNSQ